MTTWKWFSGFSKRQRWAGGHAGAYRTWRADTLIPQVEPNMNPNRWLCRSVTAGCGRIWYINLKSECSLAGLFIRPLIHYGLRAEFMAELLYCRQTRDSEFVLCSKCVSAAPTWYKMSHCSFNSKFSVKFQVFLDNINLHFQDGRLMDGMWQTALVTRKHCFG